MTHLNERRGGEGRATPSGRRTGAGRTPAKRGRNSIDMLHGPLPGKIVLFAVPLALSSILQQLFNSADAIAAGRMIGNTALAAVGGMAPVISLLIGLFVGLSIGANVAIAVRIGHGEPEKVADAVHTTAAVALISSVALTAFGLAATEPILDSIGMPADSRAEAADYLRIYFGGIAFFLVYNFGSAILRAKGDTRRPLYALAVAVALDVVLNYAAVAVFDAGVAGIAAATVASNAAAAGLVVRFLLHEDETFRLHPSRIRIAGAELRTILYIGVPSGLQSVVFSLSNVIIQAAINSFGTDATAGSSATMNFEYYTYFFVSAFSQATVTFIGQNYAAGNLRRCDETVRFCMIAAFSSALALSVLFVGLGDTSLGLFTTEAGALSYATVRMWHVELFECMPALYEVPAGAMRGMGWSILPTVVVVLGSCVLRIVFVYTVYPLMSSYDVLMNIYPVSWGITAAAMIALYIVARKRAFAEKRAAMRPNRPSGGMANDAA